MNKITNQFPSLQYELPNIKQFILTLNFTKEVTDKLHLTRIQQVIAILTDKIQSNTSIHSQK